MPHSAASGVICLTLDDLFSVFYAPVTQFVIFHLKCPLGVTVVNSVIPCMFSATYEMPISICADITYMLLQGRLISTNQTILSATRTLSIREQPLLSVMSKFEKL